MTQILTASPGGLAVSSRIKDRLRQGELTPEQVEDFREFLAEVDRDLMHHRIIINNATNCDISSVSSRYSRINSCSPRSRK